MSRNRNAYLRRERRGWGLTQKELARLLGFRSRSQVSRIERGTRVPSAESLIASLILFGATAAHLYPSLYSHIEERVLRNSAALLKALDGDRSPRAERKRTLLKQALDRAIRSSSHDA